MNARTRHCGSCLKLTKKSAHTKAPTAICSTQASTPDTLVHVRCPHCRAVRFISNLDDLWWCSCQVCQCNKPGPTLPFGPMSQEDEET